jgi:hypothetical protein
MGGPCLVPKPMAWSAVRGVSPGKAASGFKKWVVISLISKDGGLLGVE